MEVILGFVLAPKRDDPYWAIVKRLRRPVVEDVSPVIHTAPRFSQSSEAPKTPEMGANVPTGNPRKASEKMTRDKANNLFGRGSQKEPEESKRNIIKEQVRLSEKLPTKSFEGDQEKDGRHRKSKPTEDSESPKSIVRFPKRGSNKPVIFDLTRNSSENLYHGSQGPISQSSNVKLDEAKRGCLDRTLVKPKPSAQSMESVTPGGTLVLPSVPEGEAITGRPQIKSSNEKSYSFKEKKAENPNANLRESEPTRPIVISMSRSPSETLLFNQNSNKGPKTVDKISRDQRNLPKSDEDEGVLETQGNSRDNSPTEDAGKPSLTEPTKEKISPKGHPIQGKRTSSGTLVLPSIAAQEEQLRNARRGERQRSSGFRIQRPTAAVLAQYPSTHSLWNPEEMKQRGPAAYLRDRSRTSSNWYRPDASFFVYQPQEMGAGQALNAPQESSESVAADDDDNRKRRTTVDDDAGCQKNARLTRTSRKRGSLRQKLKQKRRSSKDPQSQRNYIVRNVSAPGFADSISRYQLIKFFFSNSLVES